jgi:ADP-heptose:LPS heptosyltransferase
MSHALVVRLDSDGDVLLAGPAIRAVAEGASQVTLLCGPRGARAAGLLPGVDELIVHRAPWIDPEPPPVDRATTLALVDDLAGRAIDDALILTSFHQSALPTALLLRLAGVPRIAAISEDYPGSLLDVRHRVPDDLHEVERGLSLVATLGYRLADGDDRLRVHAMPAPPCVAASRPYLVVHPGASVPARAWPPDRCRELVGALAARGERVVVTGGPDEATLTAFVAEGAGPDVTDLGGRTTLGELAGVLAGATAVVVGNTGPAHLAAAVGTPVVSLFARTVPERRWRPWRVPHELLLVDVPCAGCRARVCPLPDQPCLREIGACDVLAALDRLVPRAGRALEVVR